MARSPRRLAAPFLITLSALPACGGGPVYTNPPPSRELPPVDAGAQDDATASSEPVPTASTPASTAPTPAATGAAEVEPKLPDPNPSARHYKNADGTCWESWMGRPPKPCPPEKKCPPQPTFNPPPPHQVKCI